MSYRTELRVSKNCFKEIGINPSQRTHNKYAAGFQDCYGPVTAVCLLLPSFLNRNVYGGYSAIVY